MLWRVRIQLSSGGPAKDLMEELGQHIHEEVQADYLFKYLVLKVMIATSERNMEKLGQVLEELRAVARRLEESGEDGMHRWFCRMSMGSAAIAFLTGNPEVILQSLYMALEQAKLANSKYLISRVLSMMGPVFLMNGQLGQAVRAADESLRYMRELENKYGELLVSEPAAMVYAQLEDKQLALELARNAVDIAVTLGKQRSVLTASAIIGMIYFEKQEYGTALQFIDGIVAKAEEGGCTSERVMALQLKADILVQLSRTSEAIGILKQAISLSEDDYNLMMISRRIAELEETG